MYDKENYKHLQLPNEKKKHSVNEITAAVIYQNG